MNKEQEITVFMDCSASCISEFCLWQEIIKKMLDVYSKVTLHGFTSVTKLIHAENFATVADPVSFIELYKWLDNRGSIGCILDVMAQAQGQVVILTDGLLDGKISFLELPYIIIIPQDVYNPSFTGDNVYWANPHNIPNIIKRISENKEEKKIGQLIQDLFMLVQNTKNNNHYYEKIREQLPEQSSLIKKSSEVEVGSIWQNRDYPEVVEILDLNVQLMITYKNVKSKQVSLWHFHGTDSGQQPWHNIWKRIQ